MDVWINFKNATKWQAEGIFKCFFPSAESRAKRLAEMQGLAGPAPADGTTHLPRTTRKSKSSTHSGPLLTDTEIAALTGKLDRMDRAADAPWTWRTLAQIRDHPGVVSTELAAEVGQDRAYFKLRVRRLKALGLTESLEIGYLLSPRGEALLAGHDWAGLAAAHVAVYREVLDGIADRAGSAGGGAA